MHRLSVSTCVLAIVNQVIANKGGAAVEALVPSMRLREDIGFESLELAEFTVRIEEKFGVDVFADGLVTTVGEVVTIIERTERA